MMLILPRRLRETIRIGNAVTVTVLGINRGQVHLGVNAPKEVSVYREEIFRFSYLCYHRCNHELPPA